jgi:DNA polymerase III epsilon subunit-like protein
MTATDRVMLDIETLGTDPGCAILSIGAVRFTADGLGDEFCESVSLSSCQKAGLTIDAETLDWWLDQDDDAQEVLTGGYQIENTLSNFRSWYGDADEVWANSPSFDCVIYEAACDALGADVPWEFYEQRDFRTLKNLPGAAVVEHDGTEHDALDDARAQAKVAYKTLNRLQGYEAGRNAVEEARTDD